MELGDAKLRRNGINSLKNAIHPKHGLAWTDGKCVFLAPVNLVEDEVESHTSIKLGEFDYVRGLHWSMDAASTISYLCVVHTATVSLWKVSGAAPDLSIKQVRKINATPIPQGCLWNPRRDIICILSKDQCSFYFRHSQNKGSYALPPIESGKVSCGCWCPDGKKLVVGIGSIVLIYQWIDIDKSISEFTITAWKIPNVDGKVVAVTALSNTQLMCTADLPLENLCKNDHNMFDVNELFNGDGETSSLENESTGIEIIKPRKGIIGNKDNLMNLPRTEGLKNDSSQLILFEIQSTMMEPSKIGSTTVKGILSPDLLYCKSEDIVVVGSNTQNIIQVYSVSSQSINKIHEIRLLAEERPKGVCGIPSHMYTHRDGILVMIGKCGQVDNTFLPPSMEASYFLKLQYVAVTQGGRSPMGMSNTRRPGTPHMALQKTEGAESPYADFQVSNESRPPVHLLRFNTLESEEPGGQRFPAGLNEHSEISPRNSNYSSPDSSQLNFQLPGGILNGNKSHNKKILCLGDDDGEELEMERADFGDVVPQFRNNFDIERLSLREEEGIALPDVEEELSDYSRRGEQRQNGHPPRRSNDLSSPLLYTEEVTRAGSNGTSSSVRTKSASPSSHASKRVSETADDGRSIASLLNQVKLQKEQLIQVQKQMEEITKSHRTNAQTQNTYCVLGDLEYVNLVLKNEDSGDFLKTFVLDNGRLTLEPIKQTFGLITVELIHNGKKYVVGANSEGYLPIKLHHQQTVYITGHRIVPATNSHIFC